jgi:alpha-methylacyl-CoA racemase
VVDAAMVDGATNLSTLFWGLLAHNLMTLDIGTNMLDSGAPFYETYETSDGKFMSVGAIEGRFYAQLLEGLGMEPESLPPQYDMARWPEMKEGFATAFKTRTQAQWCAVFDGKDACVAPVLGMDEVADHAHNRQRELLVEIHGVPQPAPAPRLSRTPGKALASKGPRGSNTREVLEELGYEGEGVETLIREGIVE